MSTNFNTGSWEEAWELLASLLPVILPLAIIQLGLLLAAAIDIARKRQTKSLSPVIWVLIIFFVNMLGPVLYFVLGRSDAGKYDEEDDI
jgi:hypothetical protein